MIASIAASCWFFCAMFVAQITFIGNNVAKPSAKTNAAVTQPTVAKYKQKNEAPKVFIISDDQASFEQLSAQYSSTLMDACKDNDEVAYNKWTNMMHAFEMHAEKNNVNIKGVKMWVKVFWAQDGSVEHIGYFLKPTSRNAKIEEITALWRTFLEKYRLPLDGIEPAGRFANYASVSFPLYMR